MLLNNLARSLRDLGRLREAADLADRAYAEAKAKGSGTVVGQSLVIRASVHRLFGELDRADEMIDEVDGLWRKTRPAGYFGFGSLASERAMVAQARGDFASALSRTEEAMRLVDPVGDQFPDLLARILARRAALHLAMRRWTAAEADTRSSRRRGAQVRGPGRSLQHRGAQDNVTLGKALLAQGKADEARSRFAAAVPHLEGALGADNPETREARGLATGTPPG